jgi:G3E family GTPase
MQPGQQVPIAVLTGFLGSGKTTALNHLLRHPAMARSVVIVNEFGEIGLDHELIESVDEDSILLQSGCLCCTIRNDLIDTLENLVQRRAAGTAPDFDRVVIETTGLADPAPILQTLMTDPAVTRHFRLDGVITTVDAVTGQGTLDRHIEAVKQAALADRIVLTKTDIADAEDCLAMESRLRAINRVAPIVRARMGEIDPTVLFDIGFYDAATKSVDAQRWLNDEMQFRHAHDDHEHHHHHAHDVNRHDDRIRAVCLAVEQPIAGEAFDRWLSDLLRLRGPDLLRFKAIVNVTGLAGPLVVQGVQHVIYPPVMLKAWPSADRRSRLVFITHDIDERVLRESLGMLTTEALPVAG